MRLISPAPGGWPNLEFGNTTVSPYSPSRPHGGRDWGYYYASYSSRRTVAPAGGTIIAAYSDGGNNNGWGNYVDILIPSNGHRIVSRLAHHASISVRTGDRVAQGADIGVMGATGETYGQVHLHEELWIDGDRVNPDYYRTFDLPGTTASPTGGGGTPLEDDMTQSVTVDNKHQFAVGEEFISHYATGSQSDVTRKVTSAGDEMHQLNEPQFLDLCDGLGIPREVVRLTDGYVLNPQSGVYERGGVWSRRREGVAVAQRNMGLTQSILDKLTGK